MNVHAGNRYGWTGSRLAVVLGMTLGAVAVTFDAWADIYRIAMRDQEASHIFLVPIVATWLVWIRRGRLRYCRLRASLIGPFLIAVGWLVGVVGFNHSIQSFWHGGALLTVVGAFLTLVGHNVILKFLPAFAVLVFLVPVPGMARQQIAIPLQTATASVTQLIFDLLGVDAERTGNVLRCNGVDVAIAEACNGMRMVFALTLVSFAFAFGTPLKNYVRFLIVLASPFSAILFNVVRLVPTVLLYGYYPTSVADRFHEYSGWLMLLLAFVALLGLIRLLRWALIPVTRYTLAYD